MSLKRDEVGSHDRRMIRFGPTGRPRQGIQVLDSDRAFRERPNEHPMNIQRDMADPLSPRPVVRVDLRPNLIIS
jgi:hypothetical protein